MNPKTNEKKSMHTFDIHLHLLAYFLVHEHLRRDILRRRKMFPFASRWIECFSNIFSTFVEFNDLIDDDDDDDDIMSVSTYSTRAFLLIEDFHWRHIGIVSSDMWSTVAHFWTSSWRWEERCVDVSSERDGFGKHLYDHLLRNLGQRLFSFFNQISWIKQ